MLRYIVFFLFIPYMAMGQTIYNPYGNNLPSTKVGGNNYLEINNQGRVTAIGDSAVWYKEIIVRPGAAIRNPVSSKPDIIEWNSVGQTFSFDATTNESLFFHVEIPHDIKINTNLNAHVHWMPSTTNAGTVRFKIAWMSRAIDSTFVFTASDTLSAQQAGSGTLYKHQFLALGDIPIITNANGVSSLLVGVLLRDASHDTGTFEALYGDLGFHYKADVLGSRWEMVK